MTYKNKEYKNIVPYCVFKCCYFKTCKYYFKRIEKRVFEPH